MQGIRVILKQKHILFILTFLFLLIGWMIYFFSEPVLFHKQINAWVGQYHSMDIFFYYTDKLGEGESAALLLLILLFIRFSYFVVSGLSLMATSLLVNVLKYYIFPEAPRPAFVFRWIVHESLNTVEGTELMILRSFPSGHSAQCFALFFSLALFSKKPFWAVFWLLLACIGAFSRVYLSQHWLKDILAGALIGILFSLFFWYGLRSRLTSPTFQRGLLDYL